MSDTQKHIHPIFHEILQKEDKENLLGQKGMVIWLTGLSGSGKSTLAKAVEKELHQQGRLVKLLDGDNVRTGLCGDLGFSAEDRTENIRRVSEVAKLFVDTGIITICSFISPTREIRKNAGEIIGNNDFKEVYVNADLEECERRDVKGLYKKARAGEIKNFTGIDSPYEAPEHPAFVVNTGTQSVEESANDLIGFILGQAD